MIRTNRRRARWSAASRNVGQCSAIPASVRIIRARCGYPSDHARAARARALRRTDRDTVSPGLGPSQYGQGARQEHVGQHGETGKDPDAQALPDVAGYFLDH